VMERIRCSRSFAAGFAEGFDAADLKDARMLLSTVNLNCGAVSRGCARSRGTR
jgi:hypothetical protein